MMRAELFYALMEDKIEVLCLCTEQNKHLVQRNAIFGYMMDDRVTDTISDNNSPIDLTNDDEDDEKPPATKKQKQITHPAQLWEYSDANDDNDGSDHDLCIV
jgi:hypothetical protein